MAVRDVLALTESRTDYHPSNVSYDREYEIETSLPDARFSHQVGDQRRLLGEIDRTVTDWMARSGVRLVQLAIGAIFLWFGVLKLVPGLSPAEGLVLSTAEALLGPMGLGLPGRLVIVMLAFWEIAIGLGFLLDRYRRVIVWMLILHMFSTALPLLLLPSVVWTHFPYGLTIEGQYIVKNVVILAGAATVGATVHGGYLRWEPLRDRPLGLAADDDWDISAQAQAVDEVGHRSANTDGSSFAQPPVIEPMVWIVDENESLIGNYELDGYYGHDSARSSSY